MNKKLLLFIAVFVCLSAIIVTTILAIGQMGVTFPSLGDWFGQGEDSVYHLTVTCSSGGSANITEGDYTSGEKISLVAIPDEGYVFVGWFTEDNLYVSTSDKYDYTIEKSTTIKANFTPAPPMIEGNVDTNGVLRDCSKDFSFKMYCDNGESYLKENVMIIDAYYSDVDDKTPYSQSFDVKGVDEGEWLITPVAGKQYEEGVTYVVVIKEGADSNIGFTKKQTESGTANNNTTTNANTNTNTNTMTFKVAVEEKEEVDVNDGIVYLIDSSDSRDQVILVSNDGKVAGQAGDVPDTIVLSEDHGLKVGSVFCVHDGKETDDVAIIFSENTFFGEVVSINSKNGQTTVVYGVPEINKLFDKLEISKKESVDLSGENFTFDEEVTQQVRAAVMSSPSFVNFVAAAEKAVVTTAKSNGYAVESFTRNKLADRIDIKVTANVKNGAIVLDLIVNVNFPVTKNGNEVAHVTASASIKEDVKLSTNTDFTLKGAKRSSIGYDLSVGIHTIEKSDIEFLVATRDALGNDAVLSDFDTEALKVLCANAAMNGEINKYNGNRIKAVFESAGYNTSASKVISVGRLIIKDGFINYNVDLGFAIKLDFLGSFEGNFSTETDTVVGVYSTANGFSGYTNGSCKVYNKLSAFCGEGKIETSITFDVKIIAARLPGLSNYEIMGSTSIYSQTTGAIVTGHYAGYYRTGSRTNASIGVLKNNDMSSVQRLTSEITAAEYGSRYNVYSYGDKVGNAAISFKGNEYPLFKSNHISVKVLDLLTNKVSTEKADFSGNKYIVSVEVVKGEYLGYKDGILTVSSNAPLYFEDEIVVSIEGKKRWGEFNESIYACNVQKITLKVCYGDEQDYIESFDTEMMSHFRLLYKSYNKNDRQVLDSLFEKLFSGIVTISDRYSVVYSVILAEYVDVLFDTLATYHDMDDQITAENTFVNTEADVFEGVVSFMKELMENKTLKESEMTDLLDRVLASKVMHETLVNVAKEKDVDLLKERFALVSDDIKAQIRNQLDKYEAGHRNDGRAVDMVEAFRSILGF